jgi:HTH-type transcriptional regulator / antitoxin HipB
MALLPLHDIYFLSCISDKSRLSCLRDMTDYTIKTPHQLGSVLQGYRRERGMTQKDVGAKVGLAQNAVSQIEAAPGRVSLVRLFKLLAALDLELVVRPRGAPGRRSEW